MGYVVDTLNSKLWVRVLSIPFMGYFSQCAIAFCTSIELSIPFMGYYLLPAFTYLVRQSFNSLYGIQRRIIANFIYYHYSFNSLYGIHLTQNYCKFHLLLLLHFQFPLWDTFMVNLHSKKQLLLSIPFMGY